MFNGEVRNGDAYAPNVVVQVTIVGDTIRLGLVHPARLTIVYYDSETDSFISIDYDTTNPSMTDYIIGAAGLTFSRGDAITMPLENISKEDFAGRIDPL